MLYTLLQIIAFQALFLVLYDVFLRKETFFNYNRAYLLLTVGLALGLPFLKIPRLKAVTTKDLVIELPEVFIGEQPVVLQELTMLNQLPAAIEPPSIPLWQLIIGLGMLVAALLFALKLFRLYRLKMRNPKQRKGNILIVNLLDSKAAFSFFKTIFLGERIPANERPSIYKHELVHIKEWHSLDLLFFEVLRIVMWFNPLVYVYQNRIKELHEYIADDKAVKQAGKSSYYVTLLNQVFNVNHVSFTNTFFNKSLIKKRIAMLQRSKSKQIKGLKYALLLPLVLVMLIYTSTEVKALQNSIDQKEDVQELSDTQLIKTFYEEIVAMEDKGISFKEISENAGLGKDALDKYVVSRTEYLKSRAYMQYMSEKMIERKSAESTLSASDLNLAEKMTLHSTYTEHREWLKTQEAKAFWESKARDGELRFVVNELANKTPAEQQRFDKLLEQLNRDKRFTKLIVCEAVSSSRIVLYSEDTPQQTDQIKPGLNELEVPFSIVDEVPTTQDCKPLESNAERKACMSQFIAKHVNKNFNLKLADSLGITGRQRIFVSFKIDKQGGIKDVQARAAHKALETEAIRVIHTLPRFVPGTQKGEKVVVPYSLPIVFQIAGQAQPSETPIYDQFVEDLGKESRKRLQELVEKRDRILQNSSETNPVVIQLNRQIDSLRNNKAELLQTFLKDTFKDPKSTTRVLINRKDQLLINEQQGTVENLKELLKSLPTNQPHKIELIRDRDASEALLSRLRESVKAYPYVLIMESTDGPLPSVKHRSSDDSEVPLSDIDKAPTHPDCVTLEGNEDRKKCTTAKVASFVNRNFNLKMASKLNLTEERQRIFASFIIGTDGKVKKVRGRADHPKLKEEIERVINLLPQFEPGEKEGQKVEVPYSLPIVFQFAKQKNRNKKKKNQIIPAGNTTTILINKDNQMLIDNHLGSIERLEGLLESLSVNTDHMLDLKYDREASEELIVKIEKLVKSFPFVTINKGPAGPSSDDKTKED